MNKYTVLTSFTLDRLYKPKEIIELSDRTAEDLLAMGCIERHVEKQVPKSSRGDSAPA